MVGDSIPIDAKPLGDASEPNWGELEDLLADFARVAKSEATFHVLARRLVDELMSALAPIGAAVWMADESNSLRLECQANIGVLGESVLSGAHRRLLVTTMQSGRAEAFTPHDAGEESASREYALLLVPIVIDRDAVGLVEVIQRPTLGPHALDGNRRFTALLTELAADHLRRREVRNLRRLHQRARQFQGFLYRLHRTLDLRATAAELANEGRRQIGCDRTSVAIRRGNRYRLVAVSSVDRINRRSVAVKRLEELAARVAATGESLWFDGEDQSFAPQVEAALAKHLDESHARRVGVVPMRVPREADARDVEKVVEGPVVGVLVVEAFDARLGEFAHETTAAIARHGALALTNVLRRRSLPTLPFLGTQRPVSGEPTHRFLKIVAVLAVLGAAASTIFVQTDFVVDAQGELKPAVQNHLFAPLDGIVSIVSAAHGDAVEIGQTLIEMSCPELDLEIQKIQGEYDATYQRFLAIESALLDYGSSTEPELAHINQLAAEQEELRQLFASQQQRLVLLRAQREQLVVKSPIAGAVLTWETDEQLLNRPVRRGQRLMTVADLQGPWEAELRVPDDRVGPLLKLFESSAERPAATFELATNRGVEHVGEVLRVAGRTEADADNRPVVRVALQVDHTALPDPRPGATVYAKIPCGRESVFYVWCHDVVERFQSWLRF